MHKDLFAIFIATLIVAFCSCTPNSVTNDDNISSASSTLATTIIESSTATTTNAPMTNTICSSVGDIKPSNRWNYTGNKDELISQGYVPCKKCDP